MNTTWRHPGYDAINERDRNPVPPITPRAQPYPLVGVTLNAGNTLELLDNETLQIRVRNSDEAINLGPAKDAVLALGDAMCRLQIHF